MSKKKSTTIITISSKKISFWDAAIADANDSIREAQERIKRLRQAVKSFEWLRAKGEPFPGETSEETEAQD